MATNSNIFNHNRDIFTVNIDRSEYWDFYLSCDGDSFYPTQDGLKTECLSANIDTNDPNCVWFDTLYSKDEYIWEDAVNDGITLNNIGMTGVDNGFISYDKGRITNERFFKLFTESKYETDADDKRLILRKVDGNNKIYHYGNDIVETEDGLIVSRLDGGFYQGFYEIYGQSYKVLPTSLEDGWTLEFVLKKDDSVDSGQYTLNSKHPDNKGIFFYMGTRSENKWWQYYTVDAEFPDSGNYMPSEYIEDGYNDESCLNSQYVRDDEEPITVEDKTVLDSEYVDYGDNSCDCVKHSKCSTKKEEEQSDCNCSGPIYAKPYYYSTYNDNQIWFSKEGCIYVDNEDLQTRSCDSSSSKKKEDDANGMVCGYFADDYVDWGYKQNTSPTECDTYLSEEYITPDAIIDTDMDLKTSDGFSVSQPNITQIKTDNKFITFNRTCWGFTVDNYDEDAEFVMTNIEAPNMENYFTLFNRTCTGYTTETIGSLISEKSKEYNLYKDMYRNSFALQIKDDGTIGYKFLVKDCDATDDDGNSIDAIKIESEFTETSVINDGEWYTVSVKIEPIVDHTSYIEKTYDALTNMVTQICEKKSSISDTMKISIYVNGKIVLVSKELPMFNFKALNDLATKQEGVPFNISIGGGTQGLADTVGLNFRKKPEYTLPIEENFGGSFIGYIRAFRMYSCPSSFNDIVNNYKYDITN